MKILFIAPEIPWPLNKGTCQRSFAILKALAAEHEVTISAPATDDTKDRIKGIEHLISGYIPVPGCALRRRTIPKAGGRLSRAVKYLRSVLMSGVPFDFQMEKDTWRDTISNEAGDYDLFFCRYSYLIGVLQDVPIKRCLIDFDDVQYVRLLRKAARWKRAGFQTPLLAIEAIRTMRYERKLARQSMRSFVCSDDDKRKLGKKNITVVRNGVDIKRNSLSHINVQENSMLFIGAFTHAPNVEGLRWFCTQVWPIVKAANVNARLKVAGYGMDMVDLRFLESDGIETRGEVSDAAAEIRESLLTVVPLQFGTGTRVKIAESLGHGRVVVSTVIGAEGYDDFGENEGLFRIDQPCEMAQKIIEFIDHPGACLELGARASRVALERLDWMSVTAPILIDIDALS